MSVFDLFKVGIGPSSSHTVGPMVAARRFLEELGDDLRRTARVRAELYGSLALTGKGHGTGRAILLGWNGQRPEEADAAFQATGSLALLGRHVVPFDSDTDIVFHADQVLPRHSNAMRFSALDGRGAPLASRVYYSIGGGSVVAEGEPAGRASERAVPYPFRDARELLETAAAHALPIWSLMLANETALRPEAEVRAGLDRIWGAMQECIRRGLATEGLLPGGLHVQRRAPPLYGRLRSRPTHDPLESMDWLNVFAMAVCEENAAGGRVVTAPTNGAAGVVPAVGEYYARFTPGADAESVRRYLLTAAAIGMLYKKNASISGAEVGCQGEVGVACSMAAAGLVAALHGTDAQVEHAAEIAMEHHLGMTCDPVGGLVQIPCIERNAIGAVKAVNASRMAMQNEGGHKVSLDQIVRTMLETGLDMQSRYKETAQAGLAVNVTEC